MTVDQVSWLLLLLALLLFALVFVSSGKADRASAHTTKSERDALLTALKKIVTAGDALTATRETNDTAAEANAAVDFWMTVTEGKKAVWETEGETE